jgi:hypothetical protein
VIGAFVFSDSPVSDSIALELRKGARGRPLGFIVVPAEIERQLPSKGLPPTDEEMKLPVAISYAVMLGMLFGRSMYLTGDRSIWDPSWGPLVEIDAVSPLAAAQGH